MKEVDDDGDGDVADVALEVVERVRHELVEGLSSSSELESMHATGAVMSGFGAAAGLLEAPTSASNIDVSVMHERIAYLEQRCSSMQKKLNARPIVCQSYKAQDASEASSTPGGLALSWEPQLRAAVGPRAASFLVRHHPERALRRF